MSAADEVFVELLDNTDENMVQYLVTHALNVEETFTIEPNL